MIGLTDSINYENIADAIRDKLESEETFKPSEMAAAIEQISTGAEMQTLEYTGNGREPNTFITFETNNPNRFIYKIIGDSEIAHQYGDTIQGFRWGENNMRIVSMPGGNRTINYINDGKTASIAGYPNNVAQILNLNGVHYTVYYVEFEPYH